MASFTATLTTNRHQSARFSIANHSGSNLQQQQQQQQQSGSVQILRVTLLVPLLPCTWGAACQMKQSMCDLRDTCSLYGRDQYLIGMMITSFYLLLLPTTRSFIIQVALEIKMVPSFLQQYYLIMRFKQGGFWLMAMLLFGNMMHCSLCHINYFPTVPHTFVRVTRT